MVKTHLKTFEEVKEHLIFLEQELAEAEKKYYNKETHAQLVLIRDLITMIKQ